MAPAAGKSEGCESAHSRAILVKSAAAVSSAPSRAPSYAKSDMFKFPLHAAKQADKPYSVEYSLGSNQFSDAHYEGPKPVTNPNFQLARVISGAAPVNNKGGRALRDRLAFPTNGPAAPPTTSPQFHTDFEEVSSALRAPAPGISPSALPREGFLAVMASEENMLDADDGWPGVQNRTTSRR
jgi:hypothetical protein